MWKLHKEIEDKYETNRDGVCLVDNKPISKGDHTLLIADFRKGRKAAGWKVAHPTNKCLAKTKDWIEQQNNSDETASTATETASARVSKDTLSMIVDKLVVLNKNLAKLEQEKTELKRHIDNQQLSIAKLQKLVRPGTTGKPPRTPADENWQPVACLGVKKTDGTECKQTRVKENGYCARHQDQSGDSETEDLKQQANKKKEQELTTEQIEQLEQIAVLEEL
tara:strand:- start:535 stop:1200 length:666 start_codon:yes stop_codon:yes gene_type:complete